MARNVDVGNLIDSPAVPQQLRGCMILYSPEFNKFAIVNRNGQTEQIVSFDEYHQFVNMNIIDFNSNAQSYIESFYQNLPPYQRGAQPINSYQQDDDFAEIEESNPTPQKEKPMKDPTKKLFMFFLITFILAAVIAIGRVVLFPFLQAASNVVS